MGIFTRRRSTELQLAPVVTALIEKDALGAGALSTSAWSSSNLNRPSMAQLRDWSRTNEWVRAAIRHRREQVSSAKWIIEPIDPELSYDRKRQEQLETLFAFPNAHRDSFRTLIEPVIEDWLVIGWGCLDGREPVQLADGTTLPIREIVNKRLAVDVLSFNERTRQLEPRPVTGWHRNPLGGRQWVRVNYSHARSIGSHGRACCWFTHDHQLLTEHGWKEIQHIRADERVVTNELAPSASQRALFDGTMLGDAYLGRAQRSDRTRLSFAHCVRQRAWLETKSAALSACRFGSVQELERTGGHAQVRVVSDYAPWLVAERERWYRNGAKSVPHDLTVTPELVAAWYLDDGHLGCTVYKATASHFAYFNTHGFQTADQERLVGLLNEWGVECHLQRAGTYQRIYVTVAGARVLFERIAPFVIPSMRYKLPDGYAPYQPDAWNLGAPDPFMDTIECAVGNPSGGSNPVPKTSYCIDVEGTHNFIAAGLIAHNCLEKDQNVRRQPVGLYHVDASRLEFERTWTGNQPDAPRYYFNVGSGQKIPLRNDQLVAVLADPASDREQGLSTLDVLRNTIQAELAGATWARDHMRHQPPNGLLHLGEGAGDQQVTRFREMWQSEIAGQSSIAITGGTKDPKYLQFHSQTGGDLLQWELYFTRKLCAVFRISPQDLGITFDINRATAMTQADITRDAGLQPLLMLIEEYLNREIVWDFGSPKQLNLRFTFTQLNATDRRATTELVNAQIDKFPRITINEARHQEGRDPLPGGDVIMVLTNTGPIAALGVGVPSPAEQAQAALVATQTTTAATAAKTDAATQPAPNPEPDAQLSAPTPWLAAPRRALALALAERARERRANVQHAASARLTLARSIPGRDCPTEVADALRWALARELDAERPWLIETLRTAWQSSARLAISRHATRLSLRHDPRLAADVEAEIATRAQAAHDTLRASADDWLAGCGAAHTDAALPTAFDAWLARMTDDMAPEQAATETEHAVDSTLLAITRRNALPDIDAIATLAIGETLWTC